MSPIKIAFPLICLISFSCRKDEKKQEEVYHIIVTCGQSNTHYGIGLDEVIDAPHPQIYQLGRHDGNDMRVIPAVEPLDHYTKKEDHIGFALTFSKFYLQTYLNEEEKILIIPAGKAGSAFCEKDWNKGEPLFEDLVKRIKMVRFEYPESKLVTILWHQGESDLKNPDYQNDLDQFISDLRQSIKSPDIPFILGGMNPIWVQQDPKRIFIQNIIKNTPGRVSRTGYADPNAPIVININLNESDSIHYDAAGLRELGSRYFLSYTQLH